jgi:hypothetical protein
MAIECFRSVEAIASAYNEPRLGGVGMMMHNIGKTYATLIQRYGKNILQKMQ